MGKTKLVMVLDCSVPKKHTVVFNARGNNVSADFIADAMLAAQGDVMARVRATDLAKECSQKVLPYFHKIGPGRYTCHPVTWREMSEHDRARFKKCRSQSAAAPAGT